MSVRLAIFITHPIQYVVPIWRRLAQEPGVSVRVHFFSDCTVRGAVDPDFGVPLAWDIPLLEGYDHVFLEREADRRDFRGISIPHVHRLLRDGGFNWIMLNGYTHKFERQTARAGRDLGLSTLLRTEFTDVPNPDRPWWARWVRRPYLWWFYRKIDAFCYLGQNGLDHLLAHGVPKDKLFHSPYTVDSALFEEQRQQWTRAETRAALGIPEDRLVILFSGKFIPRKAPLLLLEALRRLPDSGRVHLIALGDGPLRGAVETAARQALGPRVTLPGFVNQSQLGKYFTAADVFVLPSTYETWGLVVNEAMQFGLPAVVSSQVGCHRDLVIPGKTGFVFPSGDANALADRLRAFVDDPLLARQMGAEAQALLIGGYTTDAGVQGILSALAHRAPSPLHQSA